MNKRQDKERGNGMIFYIGILALACVYGMKIFGFREFNKDYLSRDNTTAVKGIFVVLVFMSHFLQYYKMSGPFDVLYKEIRLFLGQLVVVMFLFYSGYGIYESIKRKGTSYVKSFPKNRVLKTLFHLDLAILIFFIRNLIMDIEMTVPKVLLSLIGWTSIGNSNWFMFAILVLYIIVYVAFLVFKKNKVLGIVATTALTVVYIILMKEFSGMDAYWYNTVLCLPLGMWYSCLKDKINAVMMKNDIIYLAITAVVAAVFLLVHNNKRELPVYILWTIMFTLLVVFGTMKVNLGNKVLYWLGNHVFSVYILQRLPMALFAKIDFIAAEREYFFVLSFAATVILAELFDRGTGALDKLIFDRKKRPAKADLKKV